MHGKRSIGIQKTLTWTGPEIPTWDGDLRTLPDFEEDCKDYINGTKREERYVCASRIKRRLTGRAKQASKTADREQLETPEGVIYLLTLLKEKLGAQPITDAGRYLAKWIFQMKRESGEPMTSYVSRDDEQYEDVVRAFNVDYFVREQRKEEEAKAQLAGQRFWSSFRKILQDRKEVKDVEPGARKVNQEMANVAAGSSSPALKARRQGTPLQPHTYVGTC